jgi:hypothetical protein
MYACQCRSSYLAGNAHDGHRSGQDALAQCSRTTYCINKGSQKYYGAQRPYDSSQPTMTANLRASVRQHVPSKPNKGDRFIVRYLAVNESNLPFCCPGSWCTHAIVELLDKTLAIGNKLGSVRRRNRVRPVVSHMQLGVNLRRILCVSAVITKCTTTSYRYIRRWLDKSYLRARRGVACLCDSVSSESFVLDYLKCRVSGRSTLCGIGPAALVLLVL